MKFNGENTIVVGAGPQALFLLRELSRYHCHVILLGRHNEIAMHSRYGEKRMIRSEEHLILELTMLANTHAKARLFIASGFYLSFLVSHFPRLFQLFRVMPGNKSSIGLLMTKTETYELANRVQVLFPKSYLISDLKDSGLIHGINYPQIAKWNRDIYLFRKPTFKTRIINNQSELKTFIEALTESERNAIVIQDFLGANLSNNFSYGAFVESGKVKLDICVNEVRHYRSGVSSVVEEYEGAYAEEIRQQAKRLLEQTQFTGFLDVEFKLKEGRLYLLEVNPRPFGFIKIMKKKYPELMPYVLGLKNEIHRNAKPVRWINLLRDMVLVLKNPAHLFHLIKLVFDIKKRTFDVWDINDPMPFFYQMRR